MAKYKTIAIDEPTYDIVVELAGPLKIGTFMRELMHSLKTEREADVEDVTDETEYAHRLLFDRPISRIEHLIGVGLYKFPPTRGAAHWAVFKPVKRVNKKK